MKFNLFKRNLLKRNQIVIYAIALMLVTAGYLNFTSLNESKTQETASSGIDDNNTSAVGTDIDGNNTDVSNTVKEESKVADIGDAALVNSNDVVKENNTTKENTSNTESKAQSQETATNTENKAEVQETASSATSSDDYFTKSKLERDTMYSQMLETYEKVLNSSNSLETQRQTATQEISKINETKNSIMVCENLIGTKGFKNNVIFVNGNSINAIIGTNQLKPEEIAQIQNIVSREMKAEIENIHIAMK